MYSNQVFISAYTALNFGDDLFISCLCKRYPQTQFHLICQDEYIKGFINIDNLRIHKNERNLDEHLVSYNLQIDVQVMIGGSLFMEPSDKRKTLAKAKSVQSERISPLIPFVIVGANFGPYFSNEHFATYKNWFSNANDVCFRDSASYELFNDIASVRWAPDILFTYPLPAVAKTKSIVVSCINNDGRIGIPNYNQKEYNSSIATLVQCYVNMGYEVDILSFCVKQGDAIAAQEIYAQISNRSNVRTIAYNGDICAFLKRLLRAEYIIGTRFHSIILGWNAGIPVFPISYNSKTENALTAYGYLGDWCRINKISDLTFEFIEGNRTKRNSLSMCNINERAEKQFQYLDQILITERD